MSTIKRVLVANRGEIAIRVFRTLRDMGINSIAIYSDADRDSLHVKFADEAYAIGGELPTESYLDIDKVVAAAKKANADAIHPGYGFLAENADFANRLSSEDIIFIGPPADAITEMGSKTKSRERMEAAGVPIVPGIVEPLKSFREAQDKAEEVGYPIAVKARSGGGGKGFRVALTPADLEDAYTGASGEGERYFNDGAVYLERYLDDPRHVEVQLLADNFGNVIHLGERDCSVQRRHQKLVEEAPGPHAGKSFSADLREKLGKIAVDAAKAVNYRGAGTIECLLGPDNTPYFLEMNTRVQVEHTVTEMITGIDIVREQVKIADGQKLSYSQSDIRFNGHALEVRINAEDPIYDFRPSSGPVTHWSEPTGPFVRVDSGYKAGSVVAPFYDTLMAKLIVWGEDRDEAIRRMQRALSEFQVTGVETLIEFHQLLMESEEFAKGGTCRDLVASPDSALETFRENRKGDPIELVSSPLSVAKPNEYLVEVDGHRYSVEIHDPATSLAVAPKVRPRTKGVGAAGDIIAPIPGNVLQVSVEQGEAVTQGQVVCILEAMKMENEIVASADGVVSNVVAKAGDAVLAGQLLLSIEESN